jgi:hypothetical protein
MLKQEREACTYDTGSLSLPTARDVNVTPCGTGAMVCDPEQDYWPLSPHSSICLKTFRKWATTLT